MKVGTEERPVPPPAPQAQSSRPRRPPGKVPRPAHWHSRGVPPEPGYDSGRTYGWWLRDGQRRPRTGATASAMPTAAMVPRAWTAPASRPEREPRVGAEAHRPPPAGPQASSRRRARGQLPCRPALGSQRPGSCRLEPQGDAIRPIRPPLGRPRRPGKLHVDKARQCPRGSVPLWHYAAHCPAGDRLP